MTQQKFESTRLMKTAYVRFIVNTKNIINNYSIMQSKWYFTQNIVKSENWILKIF